MRCIHKAGTNADVVITLYGTETKIIDLLGIYWSYTGSPSGGRLLIEEDGTTVFDLDIAAAGPDSVLIHHEFKKTVTITLKAAGSGVVGKLNASVDC